MLLSDVFGFILSIQIYCVIIPSCLSVLCNHSSQFLQWGLSGCLPLPPASSTKTINDFKFLKVNNYKRTHTLWSAEEHQSLLRKPGGGRPCALLQSLLLSLPLNEASLNSITAVILNSLLVSTWLEHSCFTEKKNDESSLKWKQMY